MSRIYLKSGQKIRISRDEAILFADMLDKGEKDGWVWLKRNGKRYAIFKIAEIAAVK